MSADKDSNDTLDPADWAETRCQAHRMLDDMLDHIQHIRDKPVWQPMPPDKARGVSPHRFRTQPQAIDAIHAEFLSSILPYGSGNLHPRFMGWVQGAGTVPGMLAEMLAAGLNANLGGRDHSGIEVERQLVAWVREMFGFPDSASGIFVTGTSMANFMAVLVARTGALGTNVRRSGLGYSRLRGYTSVAVHGCVRRRLRLRRVGLGCADGNRHGRGPKDRYRGTEGAHPRATARPGSSPSWSSRRPAPWMWARPTISNAIAALCAEEKLWFHVDGAYGALGILSPEIAPRLKGIELRRFHRLRFPQMGPGALRRGLPAGAGRQAAHGHLRLARRLSQARHPWPFGRKSLAV